MRRDPESEDPRIIREQIHPSGGAAPISIAHFVTVRASGAPKESYSSESATTPIAGQVGEVVGSAGELLEPRGEWLDFAGE